MNYQLPTDVEIHTLDIEKYTEDAEKLSNSKFNNTRKITVSPTSSISIRTSSTLQYHKVN